MSEGAVSLSTVPLGEVAAAHLSVNKPVYRRLRGGSVNLLGQILRSRAVDRRIVHQAGYEHRKSAILLICNRRNHRVIHLPEISNKEEVRQHGQSHGQGKEGPRNSLD